MQNLTIQSKANACITHRQGALTVEVGSLTPCPMLRGESSQAVLLSQRKPLPGRIWAIIIWRWSVSQGCSLRCTGTGLNHLFAPLVTLATLPALHGNGLPAKGGAGVLTVIETKIRVRPLTFYLQCCQAFIVVPTLLQPCAAAWKMI